MEVIPKQRKIMRDRIKNLFEPYEAGIGIIYILADVMILTLAVWLVVDFRAAKPLLVTILPYLGTTMGTAFAFIFSIGIYVKRRYEELTSYKMPLFSENILAYILFFCSSIILPFSTYVTRFEGIILDILVIICFGSSLFSLSLVPFVFEHFRRRLSPTGVVYFLRDKALRNIEKTTDRSDRWEHLPDWSEAWRCILEMERICMLLYREEVDAFSNGVEMILRLLGTGAEVMREKSIPAIIINAVERKLQRWIEMVGTRVAWIGQKAVDNPLAYERVALQIMRGGGLRKEMFRQTIYHLNAFLCTCADQHNQRESLRKVVYYFLPWCFRNDISKDELLFLIRLTNFSVVFSVINEDLRSDKEREQYFLQIGLIA